MGALTILSVGFVQVASAQDITGATALCASHVRAFPAAAPPGSEWSFSASPAAYGLAELTQGSVIGRISTPLMVLATGTASAQWTHLTAGVQHRWPVTPAFTIGTMLTGSWSGAAGFPTDLGAQATVHCVIELDPTWSVACGIDGLLQVHTQFQPLSRILRLGVSWKGAAAVSAGADLSADGGQQVWLAAGGSVTSDLRIRGTLGTHPASVGAALAVAHPTLPQCTIDVQWIERLGLRYAIAIDL